MADDAHVTRVALLLRGGLSFEEWLVIGRRAAARADASSWWLGDWLLFGSRAYGQRYRRGAELTGLDYQTLRNYAMVARRFQMPRRRVDLSFQHHAEVCSLPDNEQDWWLRCAAAERWSRNELRRRVQAARRGIGSSPPSTVKLRVDAVRRARWKQAAERSESELVPWMVQILDGAAGAVLDGAGSAAQQER